MKKMPDGLDLIMRRSEKLTVEYKKSWSEPKEIRKTLMSFANALGGHLFVGVEEISGVDGELPEELRARELSLYKQLSIGFVESEIEQAEELLRNGYERAACVVAGVSLERFVKTLYSTKVDKERVPKSFKECLVALVKGRIIEERQKKHLSALYNIRSDCAPPGKDVKGGEIRKLIDDIRSVVMHLRF